MGRSQPRPLIYLLLKCPTYSTVSLSLLLLSDQNSLIVDDPFEHSTRSLAELLAVFSILVTVRAVMSINETAGTSPHDNAFQNAALALSSLPLVDLPHVLVVSLFLLLIRGKTTHLPISVPALFLAAYREWALLQRDGTSLFKYSLSSVLACWLGTFAYRLVKRRIMMHHLVRLL